MTKNGTNHTVHRTSDTGQTAIYFPIIPDDLKESFAGAYDLCIAVCFGENPSDYRNCYPDVDALMDAVILDNAKIFCRKPSLTYDCVADIWKCSASILRECHTVADRNGSKFVDPIAQTIRYFNENFEIEIYRLAKEYMNDRQLASAKQEYDRLFNSLSPRSRNSLINSSIEEDQLICLMLKDSLLTSSIRNCGRKSAEEIARVFARYPATVCKIMRMDGADLLQLSIHDEYPFLTDEEATTIHEFIAREKYFPIVYMTARYLMYQRHRFQRAVYPINIYCRAYGIGCKSIGRNEVAKEYGLTSERIRQIMMDFHCDSEFLDSLSRLDWSCYPEFKEGRRYVNIKVLRERLLDKELSLIEECDDLCLAGIIAATGNYKIVRRDDLLFVVDRAICQQFDFSQALIRAEVLCSRRHETDTALDLNWLLIHYSRANHAPTSTVAKCFADMLLSYLPMYRCEDGGIFMRQNYVRVGREAYEIIRAHGEPMTLKELFQAFKEKFPDHKFDNAESLRCHLSPANGFRPIGKQSTYSLDIWNFNTDSTTTLIHRILSESDRPLKAAEIMERLKEYNRSVTPMVVVNFIYMDKKRGFARFSNSTFGLESKNYPPEYKHIDPEATRHLSFEQRYDKLKDFLDSNHHRPRSNDHDEEEASLYRWLRHVESHKVKLSDEQQQRLDQLLETQSDDFVSRHDYKFRVTCNEYRDFVHANGYRPSLKENSQRHLATWFGRTLLNRSTLSPYRKRHFQALLDYLTAHNLY